MSDELFTQAPRPLLRTVPSGGRSLAYAEIEQAGVPRIVFIHGSPGDWKAWAGYLADPGLRQYGPLLAPDRPGFGASGRGEVVPSLQQQAALLAPLLEGRGAPAIVVGHSLGGAHALRLAVDYPERVRDVLLIAASVAPEREAPRWYNELASWRLLQWIIPDELVHSNR
jgi:pimeloyl-ACP methyl ester carboxylesterase